MPARFELYESPTPENEERKRSIHARLVPTSTISTDDIAQHIEEASSMTASDIIGALSLLARYMGDQLAQGHRVHLDGIGYFQMTLETPPASTSKEIKGNKIRCKSVYFRPEKKLKNRLKLAKFVRDDKKNLRAPNYSQKEIESFLEGYFEENTFIVRSSFQYHCRLTRYAAEKWLKLLMEEGKLKQEGTSRNPYYVKVEG